MSALSSFSQLVYFASIPVAVILGVGIIIYQIRGEGGANNVSRGGCLGMILVALLAFLPLLFHVLFPKSPTFPTDHFPLIFYIILALNLLISLAVIIFGFKDILKDALFYYLFFAVACLFTSAWAAVTVDELIYVFSNMNIIVSILLALVGLIYVLVYLLVPLYFGGTFLGNIANRKEEVKKADQSQTSAAKS